MENKKIIEYQCWSCDKVNRHYYVDEPEKKVTCDSCGEINELC